MTFLLESSPTNLDPRYGTDGVSQRIDRLIFNGLVKRDPQMNLQGDLAEKWENPDPLTYIFHLKPGIRFHDSRMLTSRDVKSTIEFMMNPANKSAKRGAFTMIQSIETPDPATVIFHLEEPYASFLWNLEKSAVGIVPADAPIDFQQHPIGTGPLKFVRQKQEEEVVLQRNQNYFDAKRPERGRVNPGDEGFRGRGSSAQPRKSRFGSCPTRSCGHWNCAKGRRTSEMSSLSPDMVAVLMKRRT